MDSKHRWAGCFPRKAEAGLHLLGHTLLLSHLTFVPYAYAGPAGGTVVGGSGTIQQSGQTTNIHQQTNSLSINWSSFDLNSNEVVNFLQPSASSIALNRIAGNNASQILGQINANGQVILVNPNGIFFGQSASLNVGGLIASGLDISSDDFMNGNYQFAEFAGSNGTVVNSGLIHAATGGNVTLLGKQVRNEGVILANLGAVNLAAGKEAVLTFDNEGLIGIRVTKAVLQQELGVDAAVINSGEINAKGGRILLTASQSQDVFSRAVNTGGIRQATSAVINDDGTFTLGRGANVANSGLLDVSAADTGASSTGGKVIVLGENVDNSGVIDADSQQGNGGDIELHAADTTRLAGSSLISARSNGHGQGGIVKLLGDKVGLFDQTTIDVSGANGGGQALIGGDYQGKNNLIRNASRIYVGDNTTIVADGLQSGEGGRIVNWSDEATWFYGTASARGGRIAGNGGFVEISGKALSFDGSVNTTAANGRVGTLLFDPDNIHIYDKRDGARPNDTSLPNPTGTGDFEISETALEGLSADTAIVLSANNSVWIDNLADNQLTLGLGGGGSLTIIADADAQLGGNFSMDSSDTISTSGGAVNISGVDLNIGSLNTAGASAGDVELVASRNMTLNGHISAGNATLQTSGGITLGEMDVTGALAVTANGSVSQARATKLVVGGDSTFATTSYDADISLENSDNELHGVIGVSTLGGGWAEVKLTNSAPTTRIGDVTAYGAVTVNAAGDLSISGNVVENSSDRTLSFNFGGDNVGHAFTLETSGVISKLNTASRVSLNVSGGGGNDTITFSDGSRITGLTSVSVNGSGGNDGFNINDALIHITSLDGGSGNNDTITTGYNTANTWRVTDMNSGLLSGRVDGFSAVENLVSGNGNDTISFDTGASVSGVIDLGLGTDAVDYQSQDVVSVNAANPFNGVLNAETIIGNNRDSTLIGSNTSNVWLISDENDGALGGLNFVNFNNLTGGSADDTFYIGALGSISGVINGNGGQDIANYSAKTGISIGLSNLQFVESIIGDPGLTLTLNGRDTANAWNITGANAGTINGTNFSNFGSLIGGSRTDTFTFQAEGNLSGGINGGAGSDSADFSRKTGIEVRLADLPNIESVVGDTALTLTLVGTDTNNQWVITGANTGSVNSTLNFSSFGNLTGGTGADTFSFQESGFLGGVVNAGAGTDTVDYSARSSVVIHIANAFNGVLNAENITGNNTDSTLIGGDTPSNWTITDLNGGSVGGLNFINFNNLTGGSADDVFVIGAAGSIAGVIDGGAGYDVADYSSKTSIGVQLSHLRNVESVLGDRLLTLTLLGSNVASTWDITGANAGTVNGALTFMDFANLTGGSGADTFTIAAAGSLSGTIDGGGASDRVDYSAKGVVTIDLGNPHFSNIERVVGNGIYSTLIGTNEGQAWAIAGNNEGTVGALAFTGFNILRGGNGNDTFTVENGGSLGNQVSPDADVLSGIFGGSGDDELIVAFAASDPAAGAIKFNGQGGINDRVSLSGGNAATYVGVYAPGVVGGFDRLTYTSSGVSYAVNYQGAETVTDAIFASGILVNGTVGSDTIALGEGTFGVNSRRVVGYANKHDLTVEGLAGTDTVRLNGNVTLTNGMLTLMAETVDGTGGTIVADTLTLRNVTSAPALATSVNYLNLNTVSGNVNIQEADDIRFVGENTLTGTGALTLTAGGSIQAYSDPLQAQPDAFLVSANNLTLSAGGDIVLGGANQLSGNLDLTAANHDIVLRNDANTTFANLVANRLTATSQGAISQTAGVTSAINSLRVDGGSTVTLNNGSHALAIDGIQAVGDVSVTADALRLNGDVTSTGNVTLSASNDITDSTGPLDSGSIAAARIDLHAGTGVGAGKAVQTSTSVLNVDTATGGINMENTGDVTVNMASGVDGVGGGDITFSTNAGHSINIGRVATSRNTGTVALTSGKDFVAVRPMPNQGDYSYETADVAGDVVRLETTGGNLGTPSRPIVIWANTSIRTNSIVSYSPVFLGTTDAVDTAYLHFSAIDILTGLAGEQVSRVEDLETIDPAIFTEVRNYNFADVSILMPPDQRYEDEDERRQE